MNCLDGKQVLQVSIMYILSQACRITEEQDSIEHFMTDSATHEQLWVEKYSPKSFTELLSDEQTNREVVFLLKENRFCNNEPVMIPHSL